MLRSGLATPGLELDELDSLTTSGERKIALEALNRGRTIVPYRWIAQVPRLGHVSRESRYWGDFEKSGSWSAKMGNFLLKCATLQTDPSQTSCPFVDPDVFHIDFAMKTLSVILGVCVALPLNTYVEVQQVLRRTIHLSAPVWISLLPVLAGGMTGFVFFEIAKRRRPITATFAAALAFLGFGVVLEFLLTQGMEEIVAPISAKRADVERVQGTLNIPSALIRSGDRWVVVIEQNREQRSIVTAALNAL